MPQSARIPPHSESAEESVLGSILLNKDAIVEIAAALRPEHFYDPIHQNVYTAMLTLYEEREPIDLVTVADELKKTKSLKKIGGKVYLASLVERVPTATHIEKYAKIVREQAIKRELIFQASHLIEMAFDEGIQTRQVLDTAEQAIFSLSQRHLTRNFIAIREALAESFDRLDALQKDNSGLRGGAHRFCRFR